ncbi:MAG: HIT domain-containing protein [Arsenophonus sp.]|nr:MAG: HIT domain-containing protein [Arsenophonus sp.]
MNFKNNFNDIIQHKTKTNLIYQDKLVTAFNDINPKAPIHILVISNILIPTLNHMKKKHIKILGHMIYIATKIAKNKNIASSGYRLILNCNKDAGQEISHIHIHLIGGKQLNSF